MSNAQEKILVAVAITVIALLIVVPIIGMISTASVFASSPCSYFAGWRSGDIPARCVAYWQRGGRE